MRRCRRRGRRTKSCLPFIFVRPSLPRCVPGLTNTLLHGSSTLHSSNVRQPRFRRRRRRRSRCRTIVPLLLISPLSKLPSTSFPSPLSTISSLPSHTLPQRTRPTNPPLRRTHLNILQLQRKRQRPRRIRPRLRNRIFEFPEGHLGKKGQCRRRDGTRTGIAGCGGLSLGLRMMMGCSCRKGEGGRWGIMVVPRVNGRVWIIPLVNGRVWITQAHNGRAWTTQAPNDKAPTFPPEKNVKASTRLSPNVDPASHNADTHRRTRRIPTRLRRITRFLVRLPLKLEGLRPISPTRMRWNRCLHLRESDRGQGL